MSRFVVRCADMYLHELRGVVFTAWVHKSEIEHAFMFDCIEGAEAIAKSVATWADVAIEAVE